MKCLYPGGYSGADSYIQRLDPRVKVICFFGFILFVVFTGPAQFSAFVMYALLIAALFLLSKIPFKFVLTRSLVIVPFVLMTAVFIPFFKEGEEVFRINLFFLRPAVTYAGLEAFRSILIKAYLCILPMILLAGSTSLPHLLKALEKLRVPPVFTLILSFMYRYIFIVQDEFIKMKRAKDARSCRRHCNSGLRTLSNITGALFIKSYERGEGVYLAMCSRGFDGSIRTAGAFKLGAGDICFLLVMAGILYFIRSIGA